MNCFFTQAILFAAIAAGTRAATPATTTAVRFLLFVDDILWPFKILFLPSTIFLNALSFSLSFSPSFVLLRSFVSISILVVDLSLTSKLEVAASQDSKGGVLEGFGTPAAPKRELKDEETAAAVSFFRYPLSNERGRHGPLACFQRLLPLFFSQRFLILALFQPSQLFRSRCFFVILSVVPSSACLSDRARPLCSMAGSSSLREMTARTVLMECVTALWIILGPNQRPIQIFIGNVKTLLLKCLQGGSWPTSDVT